MVVVDLIVLDVELFQVFMVLEVCFDQGQRFLNVLHVDEDKPFKATKLTDGLQNVLYVLFAQWTVFKPKFGQFNGLCPWLLEEFSQTDQMVVCVHMLEFQLHKVIVTNFDELKNEIRCLVRLILELNFAYIVPILSYSKARASVLVRFESRVFGQLQVWQNVLLD